MRGGRLQVQMQELWGSERQRGSGVPGGGSQHVPGTACSRRENFSETSALRLEGLWLTFGAVSPSTFVSTLS